MKPVKIHTSRRFLYLAAMLVLSLAGGLAAGLIVTAVRAMDTAEPELHPALKSIILYSGISLIVTLPLLLWTFSKWFRMRVDLIRRLHEAETELLQDAWAEAGKRIAAPDAKDLEEGEEPTADLS